MRANVKVTALLAVAAVCGVLGCDSPVQPATHVVPPAGPFVVSSPVPDLSPSSSIVGGSRFGSFTLDPSVVYISLTPGAIPNGVTANIRDPRTGSSTTVIVVNGGFDPVALPAIAGDTLAITVQTAGGAGSMSYQSLVSATMRPSVVRTSPPAHKRDVPLNSIVVIVFSEPLDSATVDTGSVKLWHGTTPVAGTVRFADPAHLRAEFHPDALLASQTDYQLVVTTAILDLNGLALDSAVTIPFTTGTTGPATGLVFASVSAGISYTCGVTTGGAAYCWGDNTVGQLGNGTTASSTTPVPVAGGLTFAALSAMYDYTCGVTTAGAIYCWGAGAVQSLRAGSTPEPVAGGLTFATVSVGAFHACGVTTTGAAYCWGEAGMGELGDGTVYGGALVARVAGGLTFASVSAGVYSTCGLTTAGAAYCWGSNMLGGLGTGSTGPEQCQPYGFADCSTVPVAVTGGVKFRQVDAKVYAACGLTTGGTTNCWGSNLNDDLGYGTHTGPEQCEWDESYIVPCTRVPLAVPGLPALVSLSATEEYTCGLTSSGVAYCWGYPQSVGDLNSNTGPVAVPGGLSFAMLNAAPSSTCGVTTAGVAYCWGFNGDGKLGDGTTTSSSVPVKVAGQP